MLQKLAIAFVVFGLIMSMSGCGKKKEVRNPRRPSRPPVGTATGQEREFNGEWISKCIPDGSQWFMDYYWILDGGLINQQMWFSEDTCDADNMVSFEQYEAKFRVAGNSTIVNGARNVDIDWDRTVKPRTFTIWKLENHVFWEGRDPGATSQTRATELANRPYSAYTP